MKRYLLAAGLALAAMSPAMAADDKGACLWANQVDGFEAATKDSIVLTVGQRKWTATFSVPCMGVEQAMTVGVDSMGSCVDIGDTVIFKDNGSWTQRCMISGISPVVEPPAN